SLAGFAAGQTAGDLRPLLERFGGGVDLTIFSALPKGSGLGASSILGAAVLACLARLSGETLTPEQLIARTSLLEQRMTTSGGWGASSRGAPATCCSAPAAAASC